jgi:hypothetical protein
LHHAAAHLFVDELRVDDGAAVLDAPVLQRPDLAGLHVHLHVARLDAVGEGERPRAGHVVPSGDELGLEAKGWSWRRLPILRARFYFLM